MRHDGGGIRAQAARWKTARHRKTHAPRIVEIVEQPRTSSASCPQRAPDSRDPSTHEPEPGQSARQLCHPQHAAARARVRDERTGVMYTKSWSFLYAIFKVSWFTSDTCTMSKYGWAFVTTVRCLMLWISSLHVGAAARRGGCREGINPNRHRASTSRTRSVVTRAAACVFLG